MRNSSTIERNEFEEVANAMGKYNESAYNKGVLSKYKGQTEHQNNINTKLHSICNISRKNQVVPTPFQNNRVPRLPLRRG